MTKRSEAIGGSKKLAVSVFDIERRNRLATFCCYCRHTDVGGANVDLYS